MTKKKSKKKIRKKQKSIKDGFEQDKEEQENENPKKDAPAQKSEQRSGANRTRKSEAGSRKNSRAVKCPHAQKKTENSLKKKFGNSPFCCLSHFSRALFIMGYTLLISCKDDTFHRRTVWLHNRREQFHEARQEVFCPQYTWHRSSHPAG